MAMDFLVKLQSSARPFVNNLQREFTRHWGDVVDTKNVHVEDEPDLSELNNLPAEIKQIICSFLSSKALARMAQVSSSWTPLCSDDAHWKRAYDDEKFQWDSIQSCKATGPTIWEKFARVSHDFSDLLESEGPSSPQAPASPTPASWRETFMLNHIANAKDIPITESTKDSPIMSLNGDVDGSPNGVGKQRGRRLEGKDEEIMLANFSAVTQAIRTNTPVLMNRLASKISPMVGQLKVPFKKIHRIPMLGEGLESASKDLLYSMMWPQNSSMFNVTCLYPGVEGFGSGVGFCVDNVNLNIAALHRCPLDDPRINWKSYFQKADGVIYVVSCKSLPHVERRQLKIIIGGEEPLAAIKVPLLVLQVCDSPVAPKLRPSELAEQLGLEDMTDRMWCVQLVEMTTLKGLPEGLRWLASRV